MAQAVVFELGALVDLAPLAQAARGGDWGTARSRVGALEGRPAPEGDLAPLDLIEWGEGLGLAVGVLSDLPGGVAQELRERLLPEETAFLDASAGLDGPPAPDSLRGLCGELGVAAEETLLVASGWVGFHAAAQTGALSVGAGWCAAPSADRMPDVWAGGVEEAAEVLESPAAMRAVGEALLDGGALRSHRGSLITLPGEGRACGRYLSATDRRLARHRLSALILAAKRSVRAGEILGEVLAAGAREWEIEAGLVASIPVGTPGGHDRFAAGRAAVASEIGAEAEDLIEMTTAVEGYTSLDRDRRRMVNEGRFRVRRELGGEAVLLLDDVYTSGSQSRACARALGAAGAGEVRVLVAGVSQEPVGRACPRCGEGMMRRIYGDRGPFYGCTNFHCDHAERWDG